jgi:hypothetical protein
MEMTSITIREILKEFFYVDQMPQNENDINFLEEEIWILVRSLYF